MIFKVVTKMKTSNISANQMKSLSNLRVFGGLLEWISFDGRLIGLSQPIAVVNAPISHPDGLESFWVKGTCRIRYTDFEKYFHYVTPHRPDIS